MFTGHVGAALGLKRVHPGVNLGWLIAAAFLLDVVLWLLVMAGVEQVMIPPDYATRRYVTFVFPYSHGLAGTLGWSLLAGGLAGAALGRAPGRALRVGVVVGLAVLSHFFLDALLHVRGLPLAGDGSPRIGLGLWREMPIALGVELAVTAAGAGLYWRAVRLSRARGLTLASILIVFSALTVVGSTIAPPPASSAQMAVSGLIVIGVITGLGFGLDRGAIPRAEAR